MYLVFNPFGAFNQVPDGLSDFVLDCLLECSADFPRASRASW